MTSKKKVLWSLLFVVALATILLLLWPGVHGPFIFDDYINLSRLKEVGCVNDFYSFLWFVFGGASANGRPLSFLTFLIQDNCWPTDPLPMKQFNLLWHCLNFCLFILLTREIIRRPSKGNMYFVALFLAFVWFIHPINVSSIFLTIQRMTLMMTTCVVIGLILFVKGRLRVAENDASGYWLMWTGLFVGGFVGSFFKESAVLIVFIVMAIELTVFSGLWKRTLAWYSFWLCCVGLPILIIATYMIADPSGLIERGWLKRDYSAQEKILTEFRILWMYAKQIALPSLSSFGIYQDTIQVSRGLFQPISTLYAALALLISFVSALLMRKRLPLVSLGILWFIGGHALEAFILPIELYFEHRNYLPGFGIIIALYGMWDASNLKARRALLFLYVGLILVFAFMSYSNARVWGDDRLLSRTWYQEREGSLRASQRYIQQMLFEGNTGEAEKVIDDYMAANSDSSIPMKVSALAWKCPEDFVSRWEGYVEEARVASYNTSTNDTVQMLIKNDKCEYVTMPRIRSLLDAWIDNKSYNSSPQFLESLYLLYSYTFKEEGNLQNAMEYANKAYEVRPEPLIPYTQAVWLYNAGLEKDALEYIQKAKDTYEVTKIIKIKGRPSFDVLENLIKSSMEAKQDDR
jgi:hypothetical protein